MTREEILAAAQKCVCGDREQDYGNPERSFRGALPGDPGDYIRPQAGRKGVTHGRALQDRLRQGG